MVHMRAFLLPREQCIEYLAALHHLCTSLNQCWVSGGQSNRLDCNTIVKIFFITFFSPVAEFFSHFNKPHFLYMIRTGQSMKSFYILKVTIFLTFSFFIFGHSRISNSSFGKNSLLVGCYSDVLLYPGIPTLTESWNFSLFGKCF